MRARAKMIVKGGVCTGCDERELYVGVCTLLRVHFLFPRFITFEVLIITLNQIKMMQAKK